VLRTQLAAQAVLPAGDAEQYDDMTVVVVKKLA
jgi:hypothetical protein